jgi:plastocyanin
MNIKTLIATPLLVLAVAACGGAGSGSPASNASGSTPSDAGASATSVVAATSIHVRDFALDPKDVTVRGLVSLAVTNDGPTIHNVSIRDASGKVVGATKDLTPGQSETLTANIPAGTYVLFCSLPGHESLGVKGSLTVTK